MLAAWHAAGVQGSWVIIRLAQTMVDSMSKDVTLTLTSSAPAAQALSGSFKISPLLCLVVSQWLKIRKLPGCAARLMQLAGVQSSPPAGPVMPHYTVQKGTCSRQVLQSVWQ